MGGERCAVEDSAHPTLLSHPTRHSGQLPPFSSFAPWRRAVYDPIDFVPQRVMRSNHEPCLFPLYGSRDSMRARSR